MASVSPSRCQVRVTAWLHLGISKPSMTSSHLRLLYSSGRVSGGSQGRSTVLARLMESQIWHQLSSSVEGGFRKGTMASADLDARHFSFSLCATGVVQAATPVLELRWSESNSLCEFFKRNCLGLQQFLLPTQSPLVFAARSYGDLSSWHWNPGLGDLEIPRYLPNFYLRHVGEGPAPSTSAPLPPVWMDAISLIP